MKIFILGFFVFISWSSLSTYVYVCKIRGFCHESESVFVPDIVMSNVAFTDTLSKSLVQKRILITEDLLIYFDFDKAEFNSSKRSIEYFKEAMSYMFQDSSARMGITGFTDAVGSDDYNMALGYRRARGVQEFFEENGMPTYKISIESKGEKEPAADNTSNKGRAKNRRTIITIKP